MSSSSKSVLVYKLCIQFNMNSKTLLSSIEEVEEISFSKIISKIDLFHSATDWFTNKAIFCFRPIKPSVNDWYSSVEKLRKAIISSVFNDELWGRIKSWKQGRFERVVIYIAIMEILFARLTNRSARTTQIKYTVQGMQIEHQRFLALSDIDGLELRQNCVRNLKKQIYLT